MYQTASNHGKGDLAAFTAQSTMLLTNKASGVVLDFPSRVSLFYPVGDTVDCQVKRSTRCPIRRSVLQKIVRSSPDLREKARPSAASRSVSLAWKVGSPLRPEQESFFEALYKENFPLLWRKAAAVLHNSDLAAEVVQDLFHDTVKKIDEVMEQPEPQLWLRRQLIYKLLHA